jgi:glycosyltransferase involved in cell wall biosynthesis
MLDITVAIPTIPQRQERLRQAITSVLLQTHPVASISIALDNNREGSATTRNRALAASTTEWTAFLDDDDQFLPNHLELLAHGAIESGADVIYGLPRVIRNGRVVPRHWQWGGPPEFNPDLLRRASYITVSSLVRTDLAKDVGGFVFQPAGTGEAYDDHGFYLRMLDAGAQFHHIHRETFIWNHHGGNTSGRPDRGDSRR